MQAKQLELKKALYKATGCEVQNNGWTCGTCFFSIDKSLENRDWQSVLYIRGDYDRKDLENLPKTLEELESTVDTIIEKAQEKIKSVTNK